MRGDGQRLGERSAAAGERLDRAWLPAAGGLVLRGGRAQAEGLAGGLVERGGWLVADLGVKLGLTERGGRQSLAG